MFPLPNQVKRALGDSRVGFVGTFGDIDATKLNDIAKITIQTLDSLNRPNTKVVFVDTLPKASLVVPPQDLSAYGDIIFIVGGFPLVKWLTSGILYIGSSEGTQYRRLIPGGSNDSAEVYGYPRSRDGAPEELISRYKPVYIGESDFCTRVSDTSVVFTHFALRHYFRNRSFAGHYSEKDARDLYSWLRLITAVATGATGDLQQMVEDLLLESQLSSLRTYISAVSGVPAGEYLDESLICELKDMNKKLMNLALQVAYISTRCVRPNKKLVLSEDKLLGEWSSVMRNYPGSTINIDGQGVLKFKDVYLGACPIGDFTVTFPLKVHRDVSSMKINRDRRPDGGPDFVHPHVLNANPCLGNWLQPMVAALAEGRFSKFAGLVKGFLTSYNIEGCYADQMLGAWNVDRKYYDPDQIPKLIINGVVLKGGAPLVAPQKEVDHAQLVDMASSVSATIDEIKEILKGQVGYQLIRLSERRRNGSQPIEPDGNSPDNGGEEWRRDPVSSTTYSSTGTVFSVDINQLQRSSTTGG